MLFIPGIAHSQTRFESLRKEFVGCFRPGKISCTLMVFHDLCEGLGALLEQGKHGFGVRRKDLGLCLYHYKVYTLGK